MSIRITSTRGMQPTTTRLSGLALLLAGLIALAGCSDQPGDPGTTIHEKSWSDPESEGFHGEYVATQGAGSCKRCHDAHDDGNNCNKCHDGPGGHPAGWADPDQHGTAVANDGTRECKRCHGGNLRGGWAEVSCYACHDGPDGGGGGDDGGDDGGGSGTHHPAGWSQPSAHGAEVVANGAESCAACHGADYLGGSSGVSCYACHDGPDGGGGGGDGGGAGTYHAAGWSDGSVHGAEVIANSASSCTACHGIDFRGGDVGVSCYQCHDGPGGHVDNYRSSSRHGADARVDSTPCRACHGDDYRGGWAGVSCYQCHNGPNG